MPEATITPLARPTAGAVVRFGLATGALAFAATMVVDIIAIEALSIPFALWGRTAAVTAVLLLASRRFGRSLPLGALVAGLALGYAVDLFTWEGKGYAAQLVVPWPVAAMVVDAALWVAVGTAAARASAS
ncbi:MAG TPA: hypothetical protein VFJ85_14420 [Acidimicrobiales bacterium]|nr:hypothetical protein [Acidimicrobiales bacterium]